MSDAFRNQWIRYSANKQMLTILNWLARQHDIVVPIDELEDTTPCVLVQEISGTSLTLHYAPPDTRMFILGNESAISERRPSQWQTPESSNDPSLPQRLRESLDPATSSPLSTMDDVEMAQREAAMHKAASSASQARIMRGQPLPVSQPHHPPS